MLNENDLYVAMERGIITREQLERLELFANERDQELKQTARDEAPRFVRSFGDLFIAIGAAFFAAGAGVAAVTAGEKAIGYVACLAAVWAFAEWMTGRMRLMAPSIVLAIAFGIFLLLSGTKLIEELESAIGFTLTKPVRFFANGVWLLAGTALYYLRFRLPFALLLVGGSFCFAVLAGVEFAFPAFGDDNARWLMLGCGLVLFLAAMTFDLQDPERSGRASDAAFWLHLMAAPIITHSVLLGTVPWGGPEAGQVPYEALAPGMIVTAVIFLIVFATIAVLIDRRALLVASLGYIGSVIAYAVLSLNLPAGVQTSATLFLLAMLILSLGIGWRGLRAFVFGNLPDVALLQRLPPVDR